MRTRGLVAGLLLLLILVGCSQPRGSEVKTVRVLGSPFDPTLGALVSAFHQKHRDIRVEVVEITEQDAPVGVAVSETDLTLNKLQNGEADVFTVLGHGAINLAPGGKVAELDGYVNRSKIDLRSIVGVVDPLRIDGILYAMPIYASPQAIIYNVDMFEAAGVPLPKPGWTWEEFRAAAAKLTSGTGETKVWGFSAPAGPSPLVMNMLFERIGVDEAASGELAKEILQYWSTLMYTDRSVRGVYWQELGDGFGNQIKPEDFRAGRAAMALTGFASLKQWERDIEIKFRWDIAPMPMSRAARPTLSVLPTSFGLAKESPNADAAWRFIEFAASKEGAEILASVIAAL